jgi:recombinational DNA repair protein (RecF pathway)
MNAIHVKDERKICHDCVRKRVGQATQRNTTCVQINFVNNRTKRTTVERESYRHAQEAHSALPKRLYPRRNERREHVK